MVRDRDSAELVSRALQTLTPTLRDIADQTSLNYSTIRAWKAALRSPSEQVLEVLAEVADDQADRLRGLAAELRAANRKQNRYD